MSRTVSFRASEELDEYLEQLAEERMTTKSTVAQMLVAERVRQLQEDGGSEEVASQKDGGGNGDSSDKPPIFDRHEDKWYEPDSREGNNYAVECADDRRRYYKTQDGAADRLRSDYE